MTRPLGPDTTTDEVLEGIDLSGKVALVTGASTGLGWETARALSAHGARVVMTARDAERGGVAMASIRREVPEADLELQLLSLDSLESVRACADRVLSGHDLLHMVIANAGVMASPFARTTEGFELQTGTNHLGHFVLVNRLAAALVRAAPSRVVVVSSYGHQLGDVDMEDLHWIHRSYDRFAAYGQSKTANILYAVELDRRMRDRGVRAFSLHPGAIRTELGRHVTAEDLRQMAARAGRTVERPTIRKSVPAGAATSIWAAVSHDLDDLGGLYLEDCGVAAVVTGLAPAGVRDYAVDSDRAVALWAVSETAVGERFEV